MNILFFINSVDGINNLKSYDFIVRFNLGFNLDKNKDYYFVFDFISMYYLWYNVFLVYSNNILFYFFDDGKMWKMIVLLNGNYLYNELNIYI